jgi:hypothetical protein
MRKLAIVAAMAGLMMGSGAQANVQFNTGNNPQPDETNILFKAPETGTTIQGFVGQSAVGVNFTSTGFVGATDQSLVQKAQGQADIFNADGSALTSMEISLSDPSFTFQDFILNLVNGTGTASVLVTDNSGALFTYALGSGQNFLTITTSGGETIDTIQITGATGIDPATGNPYPAFGFLDFKQPRISGVTSPGCPPGEVIQPNGQCGTLLVPEPGSMAILGAALFGFGAIRRFANRRG